MKMVVCEICGGKTLMKTDGAFVCQSCGTIYSVEEAKKLMIDGTVDELAREGKKVEAIKRLREQTGMTLVDAKKYIEDNYPNCNQPRKSSGGCYVATAVYGSYDCPQVWTLRRFRDETLAGSWYGRAFIRTYYAISPTLVRLFGDKNRFRSIWKPMLDRMVEKLNAKGVSDTPYEDE